MDLYNIKINNKQIHLNQKGLTIMQASEKANIEIPRFCFHEKLSIAGNCRMCLVEVKNSVKPVASCAMPVMPDMEIFTNTKLVKRAREGILEFLLINHPLDCPICDQGGECDLQDQAMVFGSDRGRFYGYKRAVEDKDCGPLIKTLMTRCIHCTRCVRFTNEIAGQNFFGVTGRGSKMEIGMYIKQIFESELSGNVIDLCPVGALTSKPYAFVARPWELKSAEIIDCLDSLCLKVKVNYRGDNVLRVLPLVREATDNEWIDNKSRFGYDGFFNNRVDTPMMRHIVGSSFTDVSLLPVSWKKVLRTIRDFFQESNYNNGVKGFLGNLVELKSAVVFKDFLNSLGSSALFNKDTLNFINNLEEDFLFKLNLNELNEVDLYIYIGINIRLEFPILNSRFRESILKKNRKVFTFGQKYDLTFSYKQLGTTSKNLLNFMEGKHFLNNYILRVKNPKILVGTNILNRVDGQNIYLGLKATFNRLGFYSSLNVLNSSVAFNCLNQIGFAPGKFEFKQSQILGQGFFYYLLGLKKFIIKSKKLTEFVVLQSNYFLKDMKDINILLPGTTYLESGGTFVDIFGQLKTLNKLFRIKNPLQRVDWSILQMLGIFILRKNVFSYSSLNKRLNQFYFNKRSDKNYIYLNQTRDINISKNYIIENSVFKEFFEEFSEKNLVISNSINLLHLKTKKQLKQKQ